MTYLPALYVFVAIIGIGMITSFIAGWLLDQEKANIAAFAGTVGFVVGGFARAGDDATPWWVALTGMAAGLLVLWWQLFHFQWRRS